MSQITRRALLGASACGALAASGAAPAGRPSQPHAMPEMLPVNHDLHTHTLWSDGAHPFNTGNLKPAVLIEDYGEARLRELAQKMAEKKKVVDASKIKTV